MVAGLGVPIFRVFTVVSASHSRFVNNYGDCMLLK